MACSEARIAANRANALRSTGPRTEAGKAGSRRDAMRHGLAAVVLVPGEDQGELARRVELLQDALAGDDDGLALMMAERAGYLRVRLRRRFAHETALIAERARRSVDAFDEARRADADHAQSDIANEPATVESLASYRAALALARPAELASFAPAAPRPGVPPDPSTFTIGKPPAAPAGTPRSTPRAPRPDP